MGGSFARCVAVEHGRLDGVLLARLHGRTTPSVSGCVADVPDTDPAGPTTSSTTPGSSIIPVSTRINMLEEVRARVPHPVSEEPGSVRVGNSDFKVCLLLAIFVGISTVSFGLNANEDIHGKENYLQSRLGNATECMTIR